MIASELISNVVPVLNKTDTCLQALNWMEIFRVSHLPLVQEKDYLGLISDELIYAQRDLSVQVNTLQTPVEGTFVYEDYHIYDVIGLASARLLSVVPVLNRKNYYIGSILLVDVLHNLDNLLCVGRPGGIIVLEVNNMDYSLAEIARIVEYNEARILSCYACDEADTKRMEVTLKINTLKITPILDTFIRYGYTVKNTYVAGEEQADGLKERYGLLMKYLSM